MNKFDLQHFTNLFFNNYLINFLHYGSSWAYFYSILNGFAEFNISRSNPMVSSFFISTNINLSNILNEHIWSLRLASLCNFENIWKSTANSARLRMSEIDFPVSFRYRWSVKTRQFGGIGGFATKWSLVLNLYHSSS